MACLLVTGCAHKISPGNAIRESATVAAVMVAKTRPAFAKWAIKHDEEIINRYRDLRDVDGGIAESEAFAIKAKQIFKSMSIIEHLALSMEQAAVLVDSGMKGEKDVQTYVSDMFELTVGLTKLLDDLGFSIYGGE